MDRKILISEERGDRNCWETRPVFGQRRKGDAERVSSGADPGAGCRTILDRGLSVPYIWTISRTDFLVIDALRVRDRLSCPCCCFGVFPMAPEAVFYNVHKDFA